MKKNQTWPFFLVAVISCQLSLSLTFLLSRSKKMVLSSPLFCLYKLPPALSNVIRNVVIHLGTSWSFCIIIIIITIILLGILLLRKWQTRTRTRSWKAWFGEVLLLLLFLNSGSHPLPLSHTSRASSWRREEEEQQQQQQQKKMGKTFVPARPLSSFVCSLVCALREEKIRYGLCPGNLSVSKTFQRRGRTTG